MKEIDLQIFQESLDSVNSISTDFLAEVIIASLMEKGVPIEDIQIVRMGALRSKVGKDIENVELKYNLDNDYSDCLRIHVNRKGIYDILPEGIFFMGNKLRTDDIESIVRQVRKNHEEINDIRKFFSVFENELDRTLVQTQLQERRIDRKNLYPDFADIFTNYWNIIRLFSLTQATLFMRIVPIIHKIRGKEKNMGKALSLLLGLRVCVEPVIRRQQGPTLCTLAGYKLGENFVLGENFRDGRYDMRLIVNEIPHERIPEFLSEGKGIKIINEMIYLLFPGDMNIETVLNTSRTNGQFVLSDNPKIGSYLGVSGYLG